MPNYVRQSTLAYSTFIKRALVEALREAFSGHPDATVSKSKVSVNLPQDRAQFPSVIIKFFEREMPNAGVGHQEYLTSPNDPNPDQPTQFIKYYHRLYKGDISFDIYSLAAPDRDIVRDALIEVLAMQDVTNQGSLFLNRMYYQLDSTPFGDWHYPVLNLDLITGYGEQESIPSWAPEDQVLYHVSYRVPIFGEFYSSTPAVLSSTGYIQEVDVYPWIDGTDPPPTNPPLGGPAGAYYKYTGWVSGGQTI